MLAACAAAIRQDLMHILGLGVKIFVVTGMWTVLDVYSICKAVRL
jgi:hypothetical protein